MSPGGFDAAGYRAVAGTIAVILVIAELAFLAIRRLVKRGICDCGDHRDSCSQKKGSACKGCSVADDMVVRMEKEAKSGLG